VDAVIRIQTLTADDWELWRGLRLQALSEASYAFGARYEDWVDAPEQAWRERLGRPGWLHVVGRLDGEPAGIASGVPDETDPTVAELRSFWVAPAGRGRGVSDRLEGAVEEWAAGSGATTLRLAVRPYNAAAIAAYRRFGFTETDRLGRPLPDGRHELIFEKPLAGVGIG